MHQQTAETGPPPLSLMDALKEATKEAHDRTEQHSLMGEMMHSPMDLGIYESVLRCFLSFVRPLEARMNAEVDWAALGLDHDARHKTPWLEHDLALLGVDPAAVPDAPEAPAPKGLAEAFGCRYVLEGSTLGGQYIVKHLRKELPQNLREAVAYFDGYGGETGSKWKAFRAFGDRLIADPADIEAACKAANGTFEALGAAMARAAAR
jgi:heme oxygenase